MTTTNAAEPHSSCRTQNTSIPALRWSRNDRRMRTDAIARRDDPVTNTLVALAALLEGGPFFESPTDVAGVFAAIRAADSPLLAPVLAWQTPPIDVAYLNEMIYGKQRSVALEAFFAAAIGALELSTTTTTTTAPLFTYPPTSTSSIHYTLASVAYLCEPALLRAIARHASSRELTFALCLTAADTREYAALIAVGATTIVQPRAEHVRARERYESIDLPCRIHQAAINDDTDDVCECVRELIACENDMRRFERDDYMYILRLHRARNFFKYELQLE